MRLTLVTEMQTSAANGVSGRRRFLATTIGACAIARAIPASAQTGAKGSGSQTKEQRDGMTPGQVLDALKKGNERFRTGNMASRDYRDRAAHQRRRSISLRRGPRMHRLTCAGRDHLRRGYRRHVQRADRGERRERRPAREPGVRVRRGRRQGDPALRTHGLWRDQGGDRRRRDGQLDGVAGACEAGDVGHNRSMGRSRARTPRTSTPSHGPMSCWASTTSAAEAPSWRTWKRRTPSRSSAGCTTWSRVSWSSCRGPDLQGRHTVVPGTARSQVPAEATRSVVDRRRRVPGADEAGAQATGGLVPGKEHRGLGGRAGTALCLRRLLGADRAAGDGCRRQGRHDQACDVRREPAGMSGLQLQEAVR